jgi:hypothetical protein
LTLYRLADQTELPGETTFSIPSVKQ